MKVTFLYHSAVMIETAHTILIFDAYRTPLPQVNQQLPVYLFYSHAHHDHYHPNILNHLHQNITLIVSDDIELPNSLNIKHFQLSAHEAIQIDALIIETLASNDLGVAYMVKCDGQYIYHSGDLNYWHWQDEDDQVLDARYLSELDRIKGRCFDLACLPLDPRLEAYAMGGIELFLQYASSKAILPIHSWQNYQLINTMIEKHPRLPILQITKENMAFIISEEKTSKS